MKTYILSVFDDLQRLGDSLDVKAALCNKSWLVFNDIGVKEVYVFQKDGTLFDSINGKVTKGSWQYIKANKTLLITVEKDAYMFHPLFMDGIVLVLQMDGTEEYCFMIDENNQKSFFPKTLNALCLYFKQDELVASDKELQEEKTRQDEAAIAGILEKNAAYQALVERSGRNIKLAGVFLFATVVIPLILSSLFEYDKNLQIVFVIITVICLVLAVVFFRNFNLAEEGAKKIREQVSQDYHKNDCP